MGSQPSSMPKNIMRMSASQKEGMANPMKTSTVSTRSANELRRTAEKTPTGTAMSRVSTREATFMPTVSGSLSRILSMTGLASADMEMPKSRRTMRESQSRYWTYNGLLSP